METIERSGRDPLDPLEGRHLETTSMDEESGRQSWAQQQSYATLGGIVVALVVLIVMAVLFDRIRSTVITVVVAVSACAAIWIGANLLFDQARNRWQRFNTLWFGTLGALLGIVLHGNGLTIGSEGGVWSWILGPLLGGIAFGAIGFLLAQTDDPRRRSIISIGGFGSIGVAAGLLLREEYYPGVDWLTTAIYTAVIALLGAGLSALAKRPIRHGAIVGAALGWILGYWGGADVGDGTIATAVLGTTIPGVLLGLRLSGTTNPELTKRAAIDQGSRSWIFLGPALVFIAVMLVIPAIRTAILSLFDRNSEEFVGLENYVDTFTDDASWDLSEWTNMFTSVPFFIGVALLGIAVIVGVRSKRQTGRAVELGNPTVAPLVVGALLVCFAAFTAARGTIINNLWWVVTVTFFSTALGLAVAVLADQRGGERIAKSIIFMPMALSLVGASIIWRFVYQTREVSKEQTGVMNAVWVGLGRLSTGSGLPTLIGSIVLAILLAVVARSSPVRSPDAHTAERSCRASCCSSSGGSSSGTPRSSAAASVGSPTPTTARSGRRRSSSCRRARTTTSG
jgi:ABC-type sugar transport system permease subunit